MSQMHRCTVQFQWFLSFYLVVITKSSVVKIQNPAVNHEARPVKSNPVLS